MSNEQINIFAPEPCHVEPARERVTFDPSGEIIAARRADDRRARQRFKVTLKREQHECAAASVAAIVARIGAHHGLFADDRDA